MNQARKDIVRPGSASAPRILIVEDESDLALLLSYNLEVGGLRGRERGARRRGRVAPGRERARPRHSRLDASGRLGARNLPPAAGARGHSHAPRHHGDRARRGGRKGARLVGRRGRLCRQALLGARVDGAGSGALADAAGRSGSPNASMPATSTWIGRPAVSAVERATSTSARPSSGCSNICSKSLAGCSRARNCSMACGGRRRRSTSAPSTFTSDACARPCRGAASATRSARCAGPATPSTRPSASRKRAVSDAFR